MSKVFLDDKNIDDIKAEVKSSGILDIKVHDNGSISYKIYKSTHKNLLANLKSSVDEMITESLNDKENLPLF